MYFYIRNKLKMMSSSINEIFQRASSQGSRSNIVKPLMGMLAILMVATCVLFHIKAMIFAYITVALCVIVFGCFLFAYFHCLFKDPNLLRSEKYNLEKTALEKIAVLGDSTKIISPTLDYVVINSSNDLALEEKND